MQIKLSRKLKRDKKKDIKFVLKSYVIREEAKKMIMKSRLSEFISRSLKKEEMREISVESIYNRIFNEKRYLIPYLRRYNKNGACKKRQFFFNEEDITKPEYIKKRQL